MPEFPIRKVVVTAEEILHDGGPAPARPRRRAAALALVGNPYAGRYVEELQSGMEALKPLGLMLTDRPCASSPSVSARVTAEGASAASEVGSQPRIEVRFMKSSTPRPDA